jgi:hypothetical protein
MFMNVWMRKVIYFPLLVSDVDEDKEEDDDDDDEELDGEEVYIKTPEELYDFIKKLEKQEKK